MFLKLCQRQNIKSASFVTFSSVIVVFSVNLVHDDSFTASFQNVKYPNIPTIKYLKHGEQTDPL